MTLEGHWVRPFRVGRLLIMFSKAPFYFSRGPRIARGQLTWGRYEAIVFVLPKRGAANPLSDEAAE